MKVLSVMGPYGSGKTTLVKNLLKALAARGYDTNNKIAWVVNDSGPVVDAEVAEPMAHVITLTNGCFTCEDMSTTRDVLALLAQGGFEWVILEGYGLIPGYETRDFLESCKYSFHMIGLVSAQHFAEDTLLYADALKSHIACATRAILVTKCDSVDAIPDGVVEMIAQHNPGRSTCVLHDSLDVPSLLINLFIPESTGDDGFRFGSGCVHCDAHTCTAHAHSHEHADHHAHDYTHASAHEHHYRYTLLLKPEATFAQVKEVFESYPGMRRVKGAVEGYTFSEIHGVWTHGSDPDDRRFVTFYSVLPIDLNGELPQLNELQALACVLNEQLQGYELLRTETCTATETAALVTKLMLQIPVQPIICDVAPHRRLITHPEWLQLVKEIARRPSVAHLLPIVLEKCVTYWVACATALLQNQDGFSAVHAPKHLRELGVSLAWWTKRYGHGFNPSLVHEVRACKPGLMVAQGLMYLERLNENETQRGWQVLEYFDALNFGLDHGEARGPLIQALIHCMNLEETRVGFAHWYALKRDRLDATLPQAPQAGASTETVLVSG